MVGFKWLLEVFPCIRDNHAHIALEKDAMIMKIAPSIPVIILIVVG